jgi:peptidoglycan/LPS O-acetylase OafA/YrhL
MQPIVLPKSGRQYEIDLLRFAAAIIVLLCHYMYTFDKVIHILPTPFSLSRPIRYGYLIVDLFFMISGYVILMSAYKKPLRKFVIGRMVRLYPAVWLISTLIFVGSLFVPSFEGFSAPSVTTYLYNMSLLHEFFGKSAINGVYWTLTFEITFYFLICLIISFNLWRSLLLVLFVWLITSTLLGPSPQNNAFYYFFIPRYSPYFISGMLFFLIQKKIGTPWKLYTLLVLSYLCALRCANANRHFMELYFHDSFNVYIVLAITSLFFVLMFLIVFRKMNLSRFPKLAILGDITYPLYLVHGFGAGLFWFLGNKMNKYAILFVTTALMLVAAWAINKFVEKKLGKLLSNWVSRIFAPVQEDRPDEASVSVL